MKILLKCPTRSRARRVLDTLSLYVRMASRLDQLGVLVSCDVDDGTMTNTRELETILSRCAWHRIARSPNRSKIEACNADMKDVEWDWDIVVLVSDDMIPKIRGYDDVIRNYMLAKFPDRDGILWFNDGFQENKLNTLCIFGRAFYERQGYIYAPEYKSLFCDTELTDLCRTTYKDKCHYVPYCIIRHEHPGTGYPQTMDKLYEHNQKFWVEDMYTYISRKTYDYDWSVLIPTIPGREASLRHLIMQIREKVSRIAPNLRVEYCVKFDNKEMSIGMKRQQLLQDARGKYTSFVDDDDEITDAYIEDLATTIRGNYHVMRLRGQIAQYTFTHSLENRLDGLMARDTVFLRPPNHLNPMMADIAKLIHFKDAHRGEDLEWTLRLARSTFLRLEYQTNADRIHYIYNMGERKVDPASLEFQKKTAYETMLQLLWTPAGAVAPPVNTATLQRGPTLRLGPYGFVSK